MIVLHGDPSGWNPGARRHVVSVGFFDGVHRGHRHVLGSVMHAATERSEGAAVLTFDRHPLSVVAPERAPRLLTTLGRRLELFEALGLDVVGVLTFEGRIRDLSPDAFAESVLAGAMRASLVAVGEDFRFGRDRAGDAAMLHRLGERFGFEVTVVPLVDGNGPLSSTRIRTLVADGEVAAAAEALGRPFELPGRVVEGEGRGSRIGIPTANLDVPLGLVLPARGVYAVRVAMPDGAPRDGVANIGVRPTFGGSRQTFEVHLIDGAGDLYGTELSVSFVGRIRDEQRFGSVEELVAQIRQDIREARRLLS